MNSNKWMTSILSLSFLLFSYNLFSITKLERGTKEIFNFSIRYLGVSVAEVSMTSELEDRLEVREISVDASSTKVGGMFFKLDNHYHSSCTVDFAPMRYSKKIQQKEFQMQRDVLFDLKSNTASVSNNKGNPEHISLRTHSRDFFSALLFLRTYTRSANEGKVFIYANYNAWEATYIKVTEEKVKGKLCDKYEIKFRKESSNQSRRSDVLTNNIVKEGNTLYLWFSKDEERLPMQAEYKMSPFSVMWFLENHELNLGE